MAASSDFLDFLWDGELQQLMLMACPDGVVVSDPGENIVLYSGASEQLFGFSPTEVLGRPIGTLFGTRGTDRELRDRVRAEGSVASLEVRALRKDSTPFWAGVSASLLKDRSGEHLGTVYYVRDYSRLKAIQSNLSDTNERLSTMLEELHHVASHDGLTGLLNRASAMNEAESKFASAIPAFGVVIFDLDRFKDVNDTFGHITGDEVLMRVAWTLRQTARSEDIIGRFGGEEFVAFLPNANLDATIAFANRARLAISAVAITTEAGEPVGVTISAGVASIPADAPDLQTAIAAADDRLYEAKRTGRNQVISADVPPAPGGRSAA